MLVFQNLKLTLPLFIYVGVSILFFKHAYVVEDAYINFRSIEQLFHGNGPRWNPDERVQVYTSPLWYWLLAITRFASADLFVNSLAISYLLIAGCLWLTRRLCQTVWLWGGVWLLLASSSAFIDFTSSGLEYPLVYLIITAFAIVYFDALETPTLATHFYGFLLAALGVLVRPDLAVLLIVPFTYLLFNAVRTHKFLPVMFSVLIASVPLLIWLLFSMLYYGSPFGNAVYAKVSTGLDRVDMLYQGAKYLQQTWIHDPITLLVIFCSIGYSLCQKRWAVKFLGLAVLVYMLYVAYVGGDFMRGRFFSFAYLWSLLILAGTLKAQRVRYGWGLLIITVIYGSYIPSFPIKQPWVYDENVRNRAVDVKSGVVDERLVYYNSNSLYTYLHPLPNRSFPDSPLVDLALEFSRSDEKLVPLAAVGMFGYYAPLDVTIVDPLAITDPLLARLPVDTSVEWRIGHFQRRPPLGYWESLQTGTNQIQDPEVARLYDALVLVTQSEKLFTWSRLVAIWQLNTGVFTITNNNYL